MSKVEVDKVIPQSGTTLTIGDSGDTINIVGTLQNNGAAIPGDISSVVAGTGLSGGGTSGDVTLNVEAAQSGITSLGTLTALNVAGNATITTADNSNTLSLVSTDADATSGPRISMRRESGSPADDDIIGQIYFTGKDDGGNNTDYASIRAKISDTTDNTEDGALEFQSFRSGFFNNSLTLGPTETVFNDDSVDIDFRVESNGNADMLNVDAGTNRVGIGLSNPQNKLDIKAETWDDGLTIKNTGNFNTGIIADANRSGAGGGLLNLQGRWNGTEVTSILFQTGSDTTNKDDGEIVFRTAPSGTPQERVKITSAGNVGIGTSAPGSYKLSIQDSGACFIKFRGGSGSGLYQQFEVNNGASTIGYLGDGANLISGGSQTDICLRGTTNIKFAIANVQKTTINSSGLTVHGALSKSSGSFKIDHPLENKKDTHHLVHSFVEAPQADNIYRGKIDLINGTATVNIDTVVGMSEGTFVLLNTNIQCFTSNETGWIAVKGSVSGNTLTITAQDNTCTDSISWMVIGERQDQHMYDTDWTDENGKVIVEPLKEIETTLENA